MRPYEPGEQGDRADLWELKAAFERELSAGDAEKAASYEGKLTPEYRERYLNWVERCVERDAECVLVAEADEMTGEADERREGETGLAGYVFVLPEHLALVWDAAVVNELYVRPAHRGTGLADGLMEAALGVAREQDLPLERVVLDVDRENERARAFYERWGFEHWGEMVARNL